MIKPMSVICRCAVPPFLPAFHLSHCVAFLPCSATRGRVQLNRDCDSFIRSRSPAEHVFGCRYVLADATQHSLVLVDELGKGTEVNAGAALAGAILEALDAVGCKVGHPLPPPSVMSAPGRSSIVLLLTTGIAHISRSMGACAWFSVCQRLAYTMVGRCWVVSCPMAVEMWYKPTVTTLPLVRQGIFATHLHQLLDVDLRAPRLKRFMMETRRTADGELKTTCRMVPGQSTESLALVVAAKSGLPANVVNRAAQLYQVRHARSAAC